MLRQLVKFQKEQEFVVACSGGVDSICVADFFARGGKNFKLAYFNHGTEQADEMEKCVSEFAEEHCISLRLGKIDRAREKGESPEEYYRNCRYKFLNSLNCDIVTAQHLDDVAEGYLFSSLHGGGKIMEVQSLLSNGYRLCRPFLSNRKEDMIAWCEKHNVSWVEDKSNQDQHFPRNFIRHTLMKEALVVNPGLHNTLRKKILAQTSTH